MGLSTGTEVFTAAVFDLDGVLIDSERIIMQSWMAAAAEEQLALSEADFIQVVGCGAQQTYQQLSQLLGGHDALQRVRDRVRARLNAQSGVVFPLKPGALTLLRQMRQHHVPCAVASSTFVSEVRQRLLRAGVLNYFQAVAGGDEVARTKPDPGVYLLAADRLGVSPTDCLAFEDSDHGARAAHAAGLRVVLIPDLKRFEFAPAYLQLRSLDEALAHVAVWFGTGGNKTSPVLPS
ncbi:MAG TPA: HAD family phosphatase [Steroidobacteraceae bacterium]|jgi:HAD superfamily hydrolase (TIGR01509 family)